MANNNSNNQINIPEARQAMYNMKHEVANELGITLNQGYNGNISAKDAGHIGGNMVKNMTPTRTAERRVPGRIIGRRKTDVIYRVQLTIWDHDQAEWNSAPMRYGAKGGADGRA